MDIEALQQQLAAVQLADTVHRLSERNCVEVISMLLDNGALHRPPPEEEHDVAAGGAAVLSGEADNVVIHSLDGKECVCRG